LDAIEEFKFDACIGGARRDEEKARAKERIFSVRDDFGQWDEKNQRPELFDVLNGKIENGQNNMKSSGGQRRRDGSGRPSVLLGPHAGSVSCQPSWCALVNARGRVRCGCLFCARAQRVP
jgi:3'-phosphoadenosine 5'-phosphosulfate sulfotransferase (PAPS reductase)/FAD synthetase